MLKKSEQIFINETSLTIRDLRRDIPLIGRSGFKLTNALSTLAKYEKLTSHLYKARYQLGPNHPFTKELEDKMSLMASELLQKQSIRKDKYSYRDWITQYRRIWQENMSLFLLTAFVFIDSLFVGYIISIQHSEYGHLLLGQEFIEKVLDKVKWFDSIQANPVISGFQIGLNNIMVCLKAFAFGAILGFGSLYILIFNGLHIGAVLGFAKTSGMEDQVLEFISTHGPLELSIIVASVFCGFLYSRVFFMRPFILFKKRMTIAIKDSINIITVITTWLVLAAILEVGVSPWYTLDRMSKIYLGAAVGAIFWLWSLVDWHKLIAKNEVSSEEVHKS